MHKDCRGILCDSESDIYIYILCMHVGMEMGIGCTVYVELFMLIFHCFHGSMLQPKNYEKFVQQSSHQHLTNHRQPAVAIHVEASNNAIRSIYALPC